MTIKEIKRLLTRVIIVHTKVKPFSRQITAISVPLWLGGTGWERGRQFIMINGALR